MATKISGLPTATALTGAELLPVVQSSTTKQSTITAIGTFIRALFATTPVAVLEGGTGSSTAIAARAALLIETVSTVVSATAPDIWNGSGPPGTGHTINYTGTVTATSFAAAPQAGASRTLVCSAAAVFTASANMIINGVVSGSNYTAEANARIEVVALTTTQFLLTPLVIATFGTTASTFTYDGSGGTSASKTLTWQKIGNWVTLNLPSTTATSGTSSTVLSSNTALPAALRPAAQQDQYSTIFVNNNVALVTPGFIRVSTGGIISIYRDGTASTVTNSSTCGSASATSITYFLG